MQADVIEAEAFLYKYADVEAIDALLPDTNGILRGKRIKRDALAKIYSDGVALPASVFASLITGDTAPGTGLGLAEGDADRVCWPVPGSLRRAPWQPRPLAQLLLSMSELDGAPFFADPRQILARVLARFDALELSATVAFELEFYLLDRERTPSGGPRPPTAPGAAAAEGQTQVYGIRELDAFDAVLDAISAAAEQQELPVENIVSEYAPGQYEVNLGYRDDALAASDDAVMLRRLVKATARQHGFDATFMAKPYDDCAGSGMHVHVNLADASGNNVFAGADDPLGNPTLRHAVAGLMTTLPAATALCAPNPNSYRRLQPGAFAPANVAWGFNNRTLALRVPTGAEAARRIEHRVAGADANPYLLLAALLSGVHYGLANRLEPAAAARGNAYQQDFDALPASAAAALAAFAASDVLSEYLGADFCRCYRIGKTAELARFERTVTALEHQWYLQL